MLHRRMLLVGVQARNTDGRSIKAPKDTARIGFGMALCDITDTAKMVLMESIYLFFFFFGQFQYRGMAHDAN